MGERGTDKFHLHLSPNLRTVNFSCFPQLTDYFLSKKLLRLPFVRTTNAKDMMKLFIQKSSNPGQSCTCKTWQGNTIVCRCINACYLLHIPPYQPAVLFSLLAIKSSKCSKTNCTNFPMQNKPSDKRTS